MTSNVCADDVDATTAVSAHAPNHRTTCRRVTLASGKWITFGGVMLKYQRWMLKYQHRLRLSIAAGLYQENPLPAHRPLQVLSALSDRRPASTSVRTFCAT